IGRRSDRTRLLTPLNGSVPIIVVSGHVSDYVITLFGTPFHKDFKEYMRMDYYCWLKTYCCCFDNEIAPCSKACTKAYATLQSHYDKLTNDLRKSQFDILSYKTCLESIEARLVFYQQNETIFEEDIKLLKLDVMLRDNALVELRKKFEKAEQERDELKLKLEKFQTSLKNLSQLLASQITDKTGLGYDNQVFNRIVFDSDELISFELDVSMPASLVYDRYKSKKGYHAILSPYTRTFMPPKPNLVFHDAPTVHETVLTVKPSVISQILKGRVLLESRVGAAPLMSLRQDETSKPLLYAGWMAGPYRVKDATRGRNDDPVTSGISAKSDRGGPKQNHSSCSPKKFLKVLAAQW
nr:hypothetical protein [Tanacetum cinerariifolium]